LIALLMLTDTAVLGPGGSERFLRNLVSRLPERGYRVHLIQLSAEPAPAQRVAEPLQVPGLSLEHWPVGAVYGRAGWAAAWRVAGRVRAGEFHLVQSQHEKSDFINALLPRGPHHTLRVSCRRDMGFQKTARVKSAFRRLNARFDHLLAPTPAILQGLSAHENADAARMRCIPNGVDTLGFQPAPASARAAARQALGYEEGHFVIGCVASLSPIKRHADLVEAFALLHARLPQARLLLVGEGALRAPLQAQVAALGLASEVQFTGARADMPHLLPAMDLFALASSSEGLSNAIIEAQAFALPVVATAVGGNVDLVSPGRTGWTVPAHAPAALAEALFEAATHPAARVEAGRRAREQVLQHHSMDAMVAAYDAFYRQALAAVPGNRLKV
jgi:L-malate glycosyltransferase